MILAVLLLGLVAGFVAHRRAWWFFSLVVSVGVALAAVGLTLERPAAEAAPPDPRPNVLVIMSDDQTQASMKFMPNVLAQVGAKGASFRHPFTNWPLCCPSRATYLTGQYAINHGVRGTDPPSGGYARFKQLHGSSNLATWMRDAGYYTGYVGKYLNGYPLSTDPREVPLGWNEWYAAARGIQLVYDYALNENGTLVSYGAQAADFKGDVLTAKAVDFISRRAPQPQPFFLTVGYTAPHGGGPDPSPQPPFNCQDNAAKPAPRHATALDAEPLPKPPSFNEADVSDKPAAIRSLPPLYSSGITDLKRRYRCRMESLLHIDEGVSQMLDALGPGELKNTLVIYTSDNGFLMGEHRIRPAKDLPYDEALRVPLLMRGPGIPPGVSAREMVINADLAPTILDAADATAGLVMDGRSLLPVAAAPDALSGRALLIEKGALNASGVPIEPTAFVGIRTRHFKYVEYGTGEKELYDISADPYEERSLHADPAYDATEAALAIALADLRNCSGASCWAPP